MDENIYFEISNAGNYVRLCPFIASKRIFDNDWIKTSVELKGDCFTGSYTIELQTENYVRLQQDINSLYNNMDGAVSFNDLEECLIIKLSGNGTGQFLVNIIAQNYLNDAKLSFTFSIDQSYIQGLVNQLYKINKALK